MSAANVITSYSIHYTKLYELFILTSVMSHAKADKAICDAGLKAQSVDSGLPVIFGRDDVEYIKCSDEHGVIRNNFV